MDDWRKDQDGNAVVVPLTGFGTAAAPGVGVALRLEFAGEDVQVIVSAARAREMAVDLLQAASVAEDETAAEGPRH